MAPIIPICNLQRCVASALLAAIAAVTAGGAVQAKASSEQDVDLYFAARIAEIDNRTDDALAGYIKLFKGSAGSASFLSPALSDRLFSNAIRAGDMASAVRAARLLELNDPAVSAAPMLLFADAFRRRDWEGAKIAAALLEEKSNLGFAAPMLRAWLNLARGAPHGFSPPPRNEQSLLGFYSNDQQAYLELAAGNTDLARRHLQNFRSGDGDYARDLLVRAAPIFAAAGDGNYAASLIEGMVDQNYLATAQRVKANRTLSPAQGLAALNIRLAEALIEQKVPEQGLLLARIAVTLDPASDPAKRALARALLALKLDEAAQPVWSMIKSSSPHWTQAIGEQVRYYSDADNNIQALNLVNVALLKRPNSANLLLLSAQAYEKAGQYSYASDIYGRLARDAEKNGIRPQQRAMFLLFYANALDKDGKWDQAKPLLAQAQRLDPGSPLILNSLGYGLLERREDLALALDYVTRAHRLAPESAAITDSLGWGYFLNGDLKRAITFLEKAVQLSGSDPAINEHVGDAYWQAGRRVDARYAWNVAARLAKGGDESRLMLKITEGLPPEGLTPAGKKP